MQALNLVTYLPNYIDYLKISFPSEKELNVAIKDELVIGMGEPGLYDTPDAVARVIHSLCHVCTVGILMVR